MREQVQDLNGQLQSELAAARRDGARFVVNLAGTVAPPQSADGSLERVCAPSDLRLQDAHLLTPVPVATLGLGLIESLHSTAMVPRRIPQFARCGCLVALEYEERLQVGVGFEVNEYALQDRVPVDRFAVALFEPEQQLGFGIVQVVPPPVQTD